VHTHQSLADYIRADQIQDTIKWKFPEVSVSKDLISRIARKAHDRTYGKGISDVFQLKDYGKAWEEKGGTFNLVYGRDLGKTGPEEDKMMGIIMGTPYAHLIVDAYGDLFCADGTHGIAHYGWRALPIACCNSLDNPHPAVLVLATSENADILCLATRQLHALLRDKGVEFKFFETELDDAALEAAAGVSSVEEAASTLDEKFICPPAWRSFVEAVLDGTAEGVTIPESKPGPTLLVDGGLAFDLYGRRFNFNKKECKLHVDSHNHISVEPHK
jgi:hypothetical protein